MFLAVDIGNTNTVFAVYEGELLLQSWRYRTIAARTVDEYAAFLSELFRLGGLDWARLNDVIISSVVPEANFNLKGFARKYLSKDAILVTKEMTDIVIDLDSPNDVGADRLLNAVAVKAHYGRAAIVIDFGTATTFDVVNGAGDYCGGVIAPGINLSITALQQATAKLPTVSIVKPDVAIGKNTVSAIQSGIYWGYMGLIEGLVKRIGAEMGDKPLVIATGGLAPLFADHTDAIDVVDDELTLKGLLKVYKNYKGGHV